VLTGRLLLMGMLASLLPRCTPLSAWQGRGPEHLHHVELLESGGDQYLQLDGERLAAYDAIAVSTIRMGRGGAPLAFAASKQNRWHVVVNGVEGAPYDGIGELVLGGPGPTVAYAAELGSDWYVVLGAKRSRAWNAISTSTLEVGDDGRVSYVALDRKGHHVAVGPATYGPYASVGEVAHAPVSGRLAFIAGEGRRCWLRIEGDVAGDPRHRYERCSGLRWSTRGKHVAFVGESGQCARLVVDGVPLEGCGARPESLAFDHSGEHWAYVTERDGDVCIVFDTRSACGWQDADPPVFGSLGAGVIARAGGYDHVFVDGREVAAERNAGELQLSREGGHYAYLAERQWRPVVVHDGKAWRFDVVFPATLALSEDGRHWAALTGDLEHERLYFTVDGKRRTRFDFREGAWLLAQHSNTSEPGALLQSWVAAELVSSFARRSSEAR